MPDCIYQASSPLLLVPPGFNSAWKTALVDHEGQRARLPCDILKVPCRTGLWEALLLIDTHQTRLFKCIKCIHAFIHFNKMQMTEGNDEKQAALTNAAHIFISLTTYI